MAADDQVSREEPPSDDAAKGEAPQADLIAELRQLLVTVLSALPVDALDRLLKSRVCFLAGDDAANRSEPIHVAIDGRHFPAAAPPSRFIYLNSTQLLANKPREEAVFLVARTVAEALLWHEGKSAQAEARDFELLAEQVAGTWGFERPGATLLERIRNAIGLCCLL